MPTLNFSNILSTDVKGHPTIVHEQEKSWIRTPGYGSIHKRNLPVNPYSINGRMIHQQTAGFYRTHKTTGVTSEFGWWAYSKTGLQNIHAAQFSLVNNALPSLSAVENEMVIDLLNRIADSKVNVAVMMAEASKTSSLILSKAEAYAKALRAFRRGRFREVAKHLGLTRSTVHRTWLEYKYGWTPLLMEVKGAAELFAQQSLGGRPPSDVVSTSRKHSAAQQTSVAGSFSPGSHQDYTRTLEREIRMKVRFRVDNSLLSSAQQTGITNPALVAWELVPFSFVFDWFISVGDWLNALTALHGVTVEAAHVGRKYNFSWSHYDFWNSKSDALYNYASGSGSINVEGARAYTRAVLSLSGIRPPVNPRPLNFNRLVTGLALLKGNSRGLRV